MKKYTTILSGIILFFVVLNTPIKAQITIDQSNMPGIGSKAVMAVDNSGLLLPLGTGSQTWNYSTLQNDQTNSYIFVNPASTDYYRYFHASNVADSMIYASGYTYFSSTASAFSAMGFGEVTMGLSLAITIHPAFEQISLPATLGTTDGGASRGDTTIAQNYLIYDSGRAIINIHYTDTVDAYGTMTTPFASAEPVIRQKHYDLTVDSLMVHIHGGGWTVYQITTTRDYIYRWYTNANGINYYFATMQMDHANTHDSLVQWFNGTNAGIDGISHSALTSVYPNPCKTEITFNCSSADARQISVYDITGRQIAAKEIKNGTLIMNTSAYSAGMYFYRVSDVSGNILDRGKFIVQ